MGHNLSHTHTQRVGVAEREWLDYVATLIVLPVEIPTSYSLY